MKSKLVPFQIGKQLKRAIQAINYGASIKSVRRIGRVSFRRVKKAYGKLGYSVTVRNNIIYLDRTYQ